MFEKIYGNRFSKRAREREPVIKIIIIYKEFGILIVDFKLFLLTIFMYRK